MTDNIEHLSGNELEQFFRDHGGRNAFEKYRVAVEANGSRIDAWDDGWRLRDDPSVAARDIQVYMHTGRMPLNA